MNRYRNILYVVAFPMAYERRNIGGNISSGSGVINALADRGFNVDVLSDSPVPGTRNNLRSLRFFSFGLRWLRLFFLTPAPSFTRRIFAICENFIFHQVMKINLWKILRKNEYFFCYVRASPHAHKIVPLLKKYKVPLVLEVNKPLSMTPFNNSDAQKWPQLNSSIKVSFSERCQYDYASLITIDSKLRAQWIIDFVGECYAKKILVNYNGVDTSFFRPRKKDRRRRLEHGFTDSDVVVCMASSFRWYNDITEMLEIFEKAYALDSNLRFLVVAGNRSIGRGIERHAIDRNLTDIVKVLIEVPFTDMPKVLGMCDIGMSHFNFKGKWPHNCSIKHMESLALGQPVVATDIGEVNFAVRDGSNGYLCGEGDVDAFVNSIVKLAADPYLIAKMGKQARKDAVSSLDWSNNVERIIQQFQKQI
ncbi:glycosyltransferase family 4 protein [Alphaproteobacteria bacterium]|nr:glycosyltransferase family 4 protein [Alphaproteobacteria bacterium]